MGGITEREYIRWSLEYKAPAYLASFWPQMAMMSETDLYADDIRAFCAVSRDDLMEPEAPAERRMLLTDEEALAEEKANEAKAEGEAAESAELPPEFNGYLTTVQAADMELLVANVSFTRAFALESDYNMAIDITNEYKLFLNWGVFENTTDTDTTYIFGSSKDSDAQLLLLLAPTSAVKCLMASLNVATILYLLF
jgi:hypothetical protein